jgi:tripartite ATP-independent transporter DctM subunit
MTPIEGGLVGIAGTLVTLVLGIPVGISLAVGGFIGFWIIYGSLTLALANLSSTPYYSVANFEYTVIPLFILMGILALHSGMGEDIYDTTTKWFGRMKGGLAVATIVGCCGFGACTGSSAVAASVFTKLSLPQMLKFHYDKGFASGTIAAGACLGMLIPPSGLAVIYGILSGASIGKLLIGGIGPGLLLTALWSMAIAIRCWRNPKLAPAADIRVSWKDRILSLKGMWGVAVVAVVVIGGIYSGVFTATEAAAAGAFISFVILLFRLRFSWEKLKDALLETGATSCMIFFIFMGAIIFSRMLAVSGVSSRILNGIVESGLSPMTILTLILLVYLVLGCFLDSISMLTLTIPILAPVFQKLGFEPVWIGLVVIMVIEMGLLTPPMGLSVYIVKGSAGDLLSLEDVFRGSFFFLPIFPLAVVILILCPWMITALPDMMLGK